MKKRKWELCIYTFSKRWLYIIIGYYVVLLFGGIVVSIIIMANISGFVLNNILLYTNFVSIAVSAMLCSVQYLRRLYKSCINDKVHFYQSGEEVEQFGNIMYFILRPIFAVAFVVVAEFGLLSGVKIIVPVDFQPNEKFLYLCVAMASIIGFSVGRFLDRFEVLSSRQIDSVLKVGEDN
jgi:hypothetical protein